MNHEEQPRMYTDLAVWWPLLSPPSHYGEEAADLLPMLFPEGEMPPRTLLELGCGGGSLAYHLKDRLWLTLTDRSEQMLAVSRAVDVLEDPDGHVLRFGSEPKTDPSP